MTRLRLTIIAFAALAVAGLVWPAASALAKTDPQACEIVGSTYSFGCVCTQEDCNKICENATCHLVATVFCAEKTTPDCDKAADATAATSTTSTDPNAVVTTPFKKSSLKNPLKASSIEGAVGGAVRIFTGVVGSLALLMFVYGSFLLMTSRGEAARVEKGKTTMVMAAVGLAIVFGAYALIRLLLTSLGVQ